MVCIDSPDAARRHAESALALMLRHGVAPTPINYAVWYEHVAGRNPGVDRALAPVLAGNVQYSAKLAEEIHARCLAAESDSDEIRGAAARLQTVVAQVLQRVGEAGRDNALYTEEIASLSDGLAQAGGAGEVTELVGSILNATQRVLERNRRLEAELSTSTREIGDLKQNLESTRRAALSDPLTGLANRKMFETRLVEGAKAADEGAGQLSLLLLDIDHFKRFNDTHGHLIGDEVLKVVARELKETLKGRDTAARYGGEEFAIILPQTELRQAVVVAEHIRKALATRCLTNRKTGQNFGTITVSVGAARYIPGEPLPAFIERTDKALYAAKRAGRNRVIAAADEPQEHAA
jgi:diguanylate cyclase